MFQVKKKYSEKDWFWCWKGTDNYEVKHFVFLCTKMEVLKLLELLLLISLSSHSPTVSARSLSKFASRIIISICFPDEAEKKRMADFSLIFCSELTNVFHNFSFLLSECERSKFIPLATSVGVFLTLNFYLTGGSLYCLIKLSALAKQLTRTKRWKKVTYLHRFILRLGWKCSKVEKIHIHFYYLLFKYRISVFWHLKWT